MKEGLPPQLINEAITALKEYKSAIMKIGEATQVDRRSNSHYVNIIFEIGHLTQELKNANNN